MKILLISPSYTGVYGDYAPAAKVGVLYPPLGLAYLASNVEGDHETKILDLELNPDLEGTLQSFQPDIVGVTATTPLIRNAFKIFEAVKEFDPDIWTISGGPHATAVPDQVINHPAVDTVIHGEGEAAFNKFLANPVKGIMPKEPFVELDSLKRPDRSQFDNHKYIWSVPGKGVVPMATIMTSRGCPFDCTFCSQKVIFGKNVRFRDPKKVFDEFKHVVDAYGIRHFSVLDDTLGLNKKLTYELCDMIIDAKLDITFEGYTRVNVITRELLQKLKDAGLNRVSFGVESGNQNILDAVKKGTNLEQIRKAYEIADEIGLETRMSIIFGLPYETNETIKKTIKFIKSLKCKQAYINVATPFPGTEYYDNVKAGVGGLELLTDDWEQYRRWGSAVIRVNDLGPEDLIKWQRKALIQFYLRPHIIWYNITRADLRSAWRNIRGFAKSLFFK